MKIIFLCGSLEPGKDGVGDYTRRLAAQLIRDGYFCEIISLNEAYITVTVLENQFDDEISIPVLRLSTQQNWADRIKQAKEFIDRFDPDWLSLQYVPYSFHEKGLPFTIARKLLKLQTDRVKWHIMFHEIWIGISKTSSVKHKIIGSVQRAIAQDITKTLKPSAINTSNILYQSILSSAKIESQIMPLFSNIPKSISVVEVRDEILQRSSIDIDDVDQFIFIGIFGTFYPKAKINGVLSSIITDPVYNGKKFIFLSFGRVGESGVVQIENLKEVFKDKIKFVVLGEQSPQNISTILQMLNIGISCTPVHHIGKSGVFSAMKLHELKVCMSGEEIIPEFSDENYKYYEKFIERPAYKWSVQYIANKFILFLGQ
jgi:glycosyltransferase involved in cell wall biosynthesis